MNVYEKEFQYRIISKLIYNKYIYLFNIINIYIYTINLHLSLIIKIILIDYPCLCVYCNFDVLIV